jgi:phosphoribosylaminoimidazole-succinocarboxamide synthase
VEKRELLYEGKAKRVYATDRPDRVIVLYKDDATAFDGKKRGTITGKGELNNSMTAIFFALLSDAGIPTHFIQRLSDREQLVKLVRIVPIEVVVRNIAAGSLGDPLINDDHIAILNLATPEQLQQMRAYALAVNEVLRKYLAARRVLLVDFKLEFGVDDTGQLLVADEISPDTCRFWDAETREKLDKDRFRRDLGGVEAAYQEMLRRVGGIA